MRAFVTLVDFCVRCRGQERNKYDQIPPEQRVNPALQKGRTARDKNKSQPVLMSFFDLGYLRKEKKSL